MPISEARGSTGAASNGDSRDQHLLSTVALSDPERVAAGRFVDDFGVCDVDFAGLRRDDDTVIRVVAFDPNVDVLNPCPLTEVQYRQGVTRRLR
jgi:hypothetical protein